MASSGVESGEDQANSSLIHRKIKLLCSYGGKILPRPGDGLLRYIGGHTRIISIKRDASLLDFQSKLSEINGGPAIIRYQLPDEDLDSLITVSSSEDLENMLEEFDKLAVSCPDGSAKLRVFLFEPSELNSGILDDDPDFVTVPVSLLGSAPVGYDSIDFLEQRDRIKYLNDLVSSVPSNPMVNVEDLMPMSDFIDVLGTSGGVNPQIQDPFLYFDEIPRQEQPPVGPPQFLLKQEGSLSQEQTAATDSVDQIIMKLWADPKSSGFFEVKEAKIDEDDILGKIKFDGRPTIGSENQGSSVCLPISIDDLMTPSQASYLDAEIFSAPEKIPVPKLQSSHSPEQKAEPEEKNLYPNKSKPEANTVDEQGHRLQVIKNTDLEELQELGSGAFGTVYHGKWRGSDVAIKRINDRCFGGKPSEQERLREDFWNEACKLADLHHPNVVAFYGVVLDGPGGSMATVTEFMVNGSLWQALRQSDMALDPRKRLLIAMDAAFGMEYLHGKNMVHFDLKSDNLLVNLRDPQRPICKVGDLGLSKVKQQTLISGGVRGTLPWMAPELLNGRSTLVSEKVDVYSFGVVMWELLTGQEPYADLHHGAIIGGIVSDTLRPPIPDMCDPEWRALMEACWSTEPSARPSFTEVATKLRAMATTSPSLRPAV